MVKHIKVEFDVESQKGREFVSNELIKEQIQAVYDEYIKSEGCSEASIVISTIK